MLNICGCYGYCRCSGELKFNMEIHRIFGISNYKKFKISPDFTWCHHELLKCVLKDSFSGYKFILCDWLDLELFESCFGDLFCRNKVLP